jgi:hypothetical protein
MMVLSAGMPEGLRALTFTFSSKFAQSGSNLATLLANPIL